MLQKSFGDEDYKLYKYAEKKIAYYNQLSDWALSHIDLNQFHKVEEITEYLTLKYRPDQARVPAGNSEGGQWTSEGGGAGTHTVFVQPSPPPKIPRGAMTTVPASGTPPRYPGSRSYPTSQEDWNVIQGTLDSNNSLGSARRQILGTIWGLEGGLKLPSSGSTWAGITSGTLAWLKESSPISSLFVGLKTPADMSKDPGLVVEAYVAVLDHGLRKVGGSVVLENIGNTHAATALGDVIFREGENGGGNIIRNAVIKTDPSLRVGGVGVLKPDTLDAYSQLAKNPKTFGVLMQNLADERNAYDGARGRGNGDKERADYFRVPQ